MRLPICFFFNAVLFYSITLVSILAITSILLTIKIILLKNEYKKNNQMYKSKINEYCLKNMFMLNIFHDIKTPLTSIIGITSLNIDLRNDEIPFDKYLKEVFISSKYIANLIDKIFEFSSDRNSKIQTEMSFNISDTIYNVREITSFQSYIKHQKVSFDIKILHENVITDEIIIQQILTNLISNAIKYTLEDGIINICLNEKEIDSTSSQYIFTISDNGVGIPNNIINDIFKPFVRAHNHNTNGNGLGLAIVKDLIDKFNGTISVDSQINKGTSIQVSLPLKYVSNKTKVKTNIDMLETIKKLDLSSYNALIVDDNYINYQILNEYLKLTHINTKYIKYADEVLDTINENNFDIIFLDIHMPLVDGFTLTKMIRNSNTLNSDIIIIGLSASVDKSEIDYALEIGMNDYLRKPIDINCLIKILKEYLINNKVVTK